ncbi:MAG: nucleotidyltransferase domain-containing protein [Holophagales bacterium]|nr:nucleotidyltransferase domain-containing protein [Holophagales bacterium]
MSSGEPAPVDRIVRALEGVDELEFAYLFGSRAAGQGETGHRNARRPRPDSDWDVAVYLDEALTPEERFEIRLRLIAELEGPTFPVDVVVLNDAPPLLAYNALGGERLLERDPVKRVRFFVRTAGLAEDQRYWRDFHLSARLRRLEEGRFGRP